MIYETTSPIIDGVLNGMNSSCHFIKDKQRTLRQGSQNDLQLIFYFSKGEIDGQQDRDLEWDSLTAGHSECNIMILNDEMGSAIGCAVWSFGYSTWKGRVMNLDALEVMEPKDGSDLHYTLMRGLVEVALALDCARLVHHVRFLSKHFF